MSKDFLLDRTCIILIIIIHVLWTGIVYCKVRRKNILFLSVDDLRPEIAVYADESSSPPLFARMHTPNIDSLASKSLILKRAYVQQPLCAPSRASILTGRRPDTTGVHGFHQNFREKGGNFTTIPQFFKENSYYTVGYGKIFHNGPELWNDDPLSWSEPFWRADSKHEDACCSWLAIPDSDLEKKPLYDQEVSKKAIEALTRLSKRNENFFLAAGFYRPHLPFIFPESMLTFYPESSITLPENKFVPENMPQEAWSDYVFLRRFRDIQVANVTGDFNTTIPEYKMKELRRAYYSAVTFVDNEIGKILVELKNLGLDENTIIVFWSDHGFHLGENGEWCKHTAFELSNWAPLMIHIPGRTDRSIATHELVEFVDLFPSLVEAAGFKAPPLCPDDSKNVKLCVEGISFLPLIDSPNRPLKSAAISQTVRENATMGYTIRTKQYRYTEWVGFAYGNNKPLWNKLKATELYDHAVDPAENYNIADSKQYTGIRAKLSAQLRKGWRHTILATMSELSNKSTDHSKPQKTEPAAKSFKDSTKTQETETRDKSLGDSIQETIKSAEVSRIKINSKFPMVKISIDDHASDGTVREKERKYIIPADKISMFEATVQDTKVQTDKNAKSSKPAKNQTVKDNPTLSKVDNNIGADKSTIFSRKIVPCCSSYNIAIACICAFVLTLFIAVLVKRMRYMQFLSLYKNVTKSNSYTRVDSLT